MKKSSQQCVQYVVYHTSQSVYPLVIYGRDNNKCRLIWTMALGVCGALYYTLSWCMFIAGKSQRPSKTWRDFTWLIWEMANILFISSVFYHLIFISWFLCNLWMFSRLKSTQKCEAEAKVALDSGVRISQLTGSTNETWNFHWARLCICCMG